MDRASWCYICGLISAQSERLLQRSDYLSILSADREQDRWARLRSSLVFGDMPPESIAAGRIEDAFAATVRRLSSLAPDRRVADLFLLEREWEKFRKYLKARFIQPAATAAQGAGPPHDDTGEEDRFARWCNGEVEEETSKKPFARAAERVAAELPDTGDAAGWIDHVADECEAASLVRSAGALESEPLLDWVVTWAHLRAALSFIRAQRIGWEPAEMLPHWQVAGFDAPALADLASGDEAHWAGALRRLGLPLSEDALRGPDPTVSLARCIDERISGLTGESRGMPFGPEPVFAFFWALRMEAINLRLALSAATYGMPEQRLLKELRIENG